MFPFSDGFSWNRRFRENKDDHLNVGGNDSSIDIEDDGEDEHLLESDADEVLASGLSPLQLSNDMEMVEKERKVAFPASVLTNGYDDASVPSDNELDLEMVAV